LAATGRRTVRPWWLVAGALAIALAQPVSAGAAWAPHTFSAAAETTLLRLTNEARGGAGLAPLPTDPLLMAEARARSRDMIVRDYFSHRIPPDGRRHGDELVAMGACFKATGENIGWNEEPETLATQAIQAAFLASSPHRTLILDARWDTIGVGAFQGSTDRKVWTVLFGVACRSPGTVVPPGAADS
jgi:uncharacterized protein YkwD